MRLFKVKIENTIREKLTEIKHPHYNDGYAINVQAIRFGSTNPSAKFHLFDAGGDEFMFTMTGAAVVGTTTPEVPVTVRLPLSYFDSEGENEFIIWGEVEQLETKLPTTF